MREETEISEEILNELYIKQRKSGLIIAKLLSIPYGTIYYRLKKYGIPVRSRSEAGKGSHISPMKGKHFSKETRKKMSNAHKGIKSPNKGKRLSEEWRRKIGKAQRGAKSSLWKGGVTPESIRVRRGIEIQLWREAVFTRDNYTCQKCTKRGGSLNGHHIFNFSSVIDRRFDIINGITFCKDCHLEFHNKYGKKNNTEEQVIEFLGAK